VYQSYTVNTIIYNLIYTDFKKIRVNERYFNIRFISVPLNKQAYFPSGKACKSSKPTDERGLNPSQVFVFES
jgi:hypothetical protein